MIRNVSNVLSRCSDVVRIEIALYLGIHICILLPPGDGPCSSSILLLERLVKSLERCQCLSTPALSVSLTSSSCGGSISNKLLKDIIDVDVSVPSSTDSANGITAS